MKFRTNIKGISVLTLILFSLFFLFQACSKIPLVPVSKDDIPYFDDDLDVESLQKSISTSIQYLKNQKQDKILLIGTHSYPVSHLLQSLYVFSDILQKDYSTRELNSFVRKNFDVFQAAGTSGLNFGRTMLVTGYYQPVFPGSLSRKAPYLYPLYRIPSDFIIRKNSNGNKKKIGRFEKERFVPYWTRKEIETLNKAKGHELVWLKNPIDAFVIHVQGSALIRLTDGTIKGIHYAHRNGHPYRSIGKFMVDTNRMTLEDASMDSIRNYLITHPEERDEILYHNKSFIFFHWTQTHGAIGSLGKVLTPGRSIAADQSCFPPGGLGFLISRKPVVTNDRVTGWKQLNRFVTVQDKGSAIRGPGRVDLFWGAGNNAGLAAGRMKEEGTLYFLILKRSS